MPRSASFPACGSNGDETLRSLAREQSPCARESIAGGTILTLAELVALAGAGAAVFFPLDLAGVAGQHAGFFQWATQFFLGHLEQRAGNPVADGTGLAADPAALHVDDDVEAVARLGQFERLPDNEALCLIGEEFLDRLFVDRDKAGFDLGGPKATSP